MRSRILPLILALSVALTGCKVSTEVKTQDVVEEVAPVQRGAITSNVQEQEDLIEFSKEEMALRKDIDQMYEKMKENPLELAKQLRKVWFYEYELGIHKGVIQESLERSLQGSGLSLAVKAFLEIIAEFKSKGVSISDDETARFMSTIFLIIPESEWKNVRSDLGASGYFQFTYSTAKGYGLITKESDLRSDIYSASRAAAKYLIKMYLLFNRDYDLMLAAYNSGMPLKYRLQAIGDGQLVSYQGYLNYLREKMDSELEKLREGMVKVRSGMSVHRILKSFGIEPNKENIEIFSKHNRLRNGNLLAGTVVTVPPSLMTEETQVSLRSMATARYIRENLNYPPKFYAALDSIELHFPGFVAFANGTKTYEELLAIAKVDGLKMPTENPPAQVVDGVKYTVKSGDTMWGILLAHGVNPTKKNIRTISGGHSNLSIGQKLTIPRELITPSSDRKPVPKPRPRRGKMAAVIKYNH